MVTKYGTQLVMHDRQGRLIVCEVFYSMTHMSDAIDRYHALMRNDKMDPVASHYFVPISVVE